MVSVLKANCHLVVSRSEQSHLLGGAFSESVSNVASYPYTLNGLGPSYLKDSLPLQEII